ncbi:MAG: uridine kinase, partial [Acutalibacteraceae bacterium]|nr:uridine kinase [Acutalibacteraceae bacterium]
IDKHLRKGRVRVAIEGGSASGKTTLSRMLYEIYGCTVFHTDDFFLRPEQRTTERYTETGGNFDRERFLEEVLIPLSNNDIISYRRFDCTEMKLQPATEVRPGKLTIVEGAYSMHPELAGFYDFSVFLDIPSDLQKKRIMKRNSPQMTERFFNEWIPLEKTYFEATQVEKRCDMCIHICF